MLAQARTSDRPMRHKFAMKQEALMRRGGGWERPAPGAETTSAPRRDVAFESGGVTCRAWAYAPCVDVARPAPCIVMAHGLGGTRDVRARALCAKRSPKPASSCCCSTTAISAPATARRARSSRSAASSRTGPPRSPLRPLHGGVDPHRIALWGTSLSGGHVLIAAAQGSRRSLPSRRNARCSTAPPASRMLAKELGLRATSCGSGWPGSSTRRARFSD